MPQYELPVAGDGPMPVNKIICIGRNYADHVREMGNDPARQLPIFFFKPHSALNTSGSFTYPAFSEDVHHELELVVALEKAGSCVTEDQAKHMIAGFAVGLDMTCRDLQRKAKEDGGPWEMAKAFDGSAPCSALQPGDYRDLEDLGELRLTRNGQLVQQGHVREMIWSVPELIARLSHYFRLQAGDLIFTGTPAGVGPVTAGDILEGDIEGLAVRLKVEVV